MAPKLKSPVRLLLLAVFLELSAQGSTDREVKPEVSAHTKGKEMGEMRAAWAKPFPVRDWASGRAASPARGSSP